MADAERTRLARELLDRGYAIHMAGRLEEAIELYSRSIDALPTAEAYTFRGWAQSMRNRLQDALADCHRAIDVDPGFGNPYNDIGAYLIELGRLDEAVPWLLKAIEAPRYEARGHPWANLGRIEEARGRWRAALAHYHRALAESPEHAAATRGVARMRARLN